MKTKTLRKRFTLRALLVIVTITCDVLGLFYPRTKYSVTLKLPSLLRSNPARPDYMILDSAVAERITSNSAAAAYSPGKGQF